MIVFKFVLRTRLDLLRTSIPNLTFLCRGCHDDKDSKEKSQEQEKRIKLREDGYPEEPTTCCMSGCPNCVWLEYAEKLSEYYKDGGEAAIKEINEKVTDPNIKAFLLHEMRMAKKSK